jgi:hypothetical protein
VGGDAVRQRYERLDDLPAVLLVAGDAVCSFNPIYGQEMTVAALEAVTLRRLLSEGEVPSPQRWFAAIAPIVDVAWELAVGADLAVRGIKARRSVQTRVLNRYIARFHAAAAHDPALTALFVRVAGLLDPPTRLLRPTTVARVLRGSLQRARRDAPTATGTR